MVSSIMITDTSRIANLEDLMLKLVDAIRRRGTEQDGIGWPSFHSEILEILQKLKDAQSGQV